MEKKKFNKRGLKLSEAKESYSFNISKLATYNLDNYISSYSTPESIRVKALFLLKKFCFFIEKSGDKDIGKNCFRVSTSILKQMVGTDNYFLVMNLLTQAGFISLEKNYSVGGRKNGFARIYRLNVEKIFTSTDPLIFGDVEKITTTDKTIRKYILLEKISKQQANDTDEDNGGSSNVSESTSPLSIVANRTQRNIFDRVIGPLTEDELSSLTTRKSTYCNREYTTLVQVKGDIKKFWTCLDTGESLMDYDIANTHYYFSIKMFEEAHPEHKEEINALWAWYADGIKKQLLPENFETLCEEEQNEAKDNVKKRTGTYFASRSPIVSIGYISKNFPNYDKFIKSFRNKDKNQAIDSLLCNMEHAWLTNIFNLIVASEHFGENGMFHPEHDGFRVRESFAPHAHKILQDYINKLEPRMIIKYGGKKMTIKKDTAEKK